MQARPRKPRTTHQSDTETSPYYYRARYYDSSVGRFLTEDPKRFRAGINFFTYVSNSPVDDVDPTGLYQLQGFPPEQAAQMQIAIGELWGKLLKNPCCINPKLRDRLPGCCSRGTAMVALLSFMPRSLGQAIVGKSAVLAISSDSKPTRF